MLIFANLFEMKRFLIMMCIEMRNGNICCKVLHGKEILGINKNCFIKQFKFIEIISQAFLYPVCIKTF